MEFHLEHAGEDEEALNDILLEGKADAGDALDSAPSWILRENPHLVHIWRIFFDLSRQRAKLATMSYILVGPISFPDILSYCKLYAIKESGTLTEHLIKMDGLWVPRMNQQIISAAKANAKN